MNELALFAGAGGGILGGHLLGWRTVCAVEIEDYPRRVLLQRQADGILPRFPIWDDVCTFDGKPWRGKVDVISGGFPCTDISAAGKGAGIEGKESGLWRHMARIIGEVRPQHVLVENSPMLTIRGGVRVIADLAEMGFDCRWGIISAADATAPHLRERMWIVANANNAGGGTPSGGIDEYRQTQNQGREKQPQPGVGRQGATMSDSVSDATWGAQRGTGGERCGGREKPSQRKRDEVGRDFADFRGVWETEPRLGRVADGVANRMDRLKAVGNGQVPAVAALAWRVLGGE